MVLVQPADAVDHDDWRVQLFRRYSTVTGFVKMLPNVIAFGANAEAAAVLEATALGEAIAACGRIFKSVHILNYIDTDESYRRDIKHVRNLQEGRHALARKICHGKKGELYHRYERGLENQLGILGLVLNCATL